MSDFSFADGFILGSPRVAEAKRRGDPMMYFDWDRARELIEEHGADYAEAGLAGDWTYTGGCIWRGGQPYTDDYVYLNSLWATPTLRINGTDYPCFTVQEPINWQPDEAWPQR